ncbi:alpha/beta fold hydrolase [Haladaptatus sp. CMAA 1911]|uniref:alpha/beta fold hydrolase n=1 Tax=unclassified Haladaptatus TaxID=2622732 RepID=UPI0037541BC0
MSLDHVAPGNDEEETYLDALSMACDHYDIDAESKYVHFSNPAVRVHYLTAGDGPPLVLLHGLGSTSAVWLPLLDALTDRFTVIAPDRPGRGLSTPTDYRETDLRTFGVEYVVDLLDELGIEETRVVGNSLGGFQALALASDHPARVKRLCLVGAPAGLSRSVPFGFRLFGVPMVGRWLFDYSEATTVADARKTNRQMNVADDSALPDCYFGPEIRTEAVPGQRESLWTLLEALGSVRGMAPRFDLRDDLPTGVPTRFVWGTEDYFWKPAVGRPVVGEMANADMVVLDGYGHVPWLEPGDAAEEATVAFLTDDGT